jgi:hypothetical protein
MTGKATAMTGKSDAPLYADIRRVIGGIQFTIGPMPNGQPWIMRLAYQTAADVDHHHCGRRGRQAGDDLRRTPGRRDGGNERS